MPEGSSGESEPLARAHAVVPPSVVEPVRAQTAPSAQQHIRSHDIRPEAWTCSGCGKFNVEVGAPFAARQPPDLHHRTSPETTNAGMTSIRIPIFSRRLVAPCAEVLSSCTSTPSSLRLRCPAFSCSIAVVGLGRYQTLRMRRSRCEWCRVLMKPFGLSRVRDRRQSALRAVVGSSGLFFGSSPCFRARDPLPMSRSASARECGAIVLDGFGAVVVWGPPMAVGVAGCGHPWRRAGA